MSNNKWLLVTNYVTKHKHYFDVTKIQEVVDEGTHRTIVGDSLGYSTSMGGMHHVLKVEESFDVIKTAMDSMYS